MSYLHILRLSGLELIRKKDIWRDVQEDYIDSFKIVRISVMLGIMLIVRRFVISAIILVLVNFIFFFIIYYIIRNIK